VCEDGTRFQCRVCFKRFAQKGGVLAHIRIHTGQRPFARCIPESSHSSAFNVGRASTESWGCCYMIDSIFWQKKWRHSSIMCMDGSRPLCRQCSLNRLVFLVSIKPFATTNLLKSGSSHTKLQFVRHKTVRLLESSSQQQEAGRLEQFWLDSFHSN